MKTTGTNYKISWFKREKDDGTLNLSPDFNRRSVWSEEKESYLIDTILNELPVPEVYLRTIPAPTGKTRYEVVDGQQRIGAILRFSVNELRLEGQDISPKFANRKFEDLNDDEKTQFWSYELVVRDIGNVSDVAVRDLFRRLNINAMALKDQELRNAKYKGFFITLAEKLADDNWWVQRGIVSVDQVRRMSDVEYVSELLVGLMAGPQDKKKSLENYYADFEHSFPDQDKWEVRFAKTLQLLKTTLTDSQVGTWAGKSDFYTLFLAFGKLVEDGVELRPVQTKRIAEALSEFQAKVVQAKRKDNRRKFPANVQKYAQAVALAASDRQRRIDRQVVVDKIIADALN